MSTSNPSHLLLNRNPRSPAHPQLVAQTSLYAPTPTPGSHLFSFNSASSAAGAPSSTPPASEHMLHHVRSHSTPALSTLPDDASRLGLSTAEEEDEEEDDLVIHPTFWRDAALPGRVKVAVGRHEFWCHKEVLWFSSPFFNALLQGSWAETEVTDAPRFPAPSSPTDTDAPGRPDSMLDVPAFNEEERGKARLGEGDKEEKEEKRDERGDSPPAALEGDETEAKASVYLDAVDEGVADLMRELRDLPDPSGDALETLVDGDSASRAGEDVPHEQDAERESERTERAEKAVKVEPVAEGKAATEEDKAAKLELELARRHAKRCSTSSLSLARRRTHSAGHERRRHERHDAVVELHEESPAAFQDFLFWAYPHLDCKVTWTNVAGLLALSSKLIVPALQTLCERFLLTHASGRPIEALALAEQHANSELYREASRFVLDQATWDEDEFESLSEQTQIKLSKRRTWFLERLLKLGTIDVKKEYTCRPDCPDPSRCQTQLDEKWHQANTAVSRYGPPQPSVAFRCLRQLETFPTNPSLVMHHPLCQSTAKSWIASLFDRMFQPKMAFGALSPGTEKYWLYITIN